MFDMFLNLTMFDLTRYLHRTYVLYYISLPIDMVPHGVQE